TISAPSTDPLVISTGATNDFRLVAETFGYATWTSNQMAAISSGGTTPGNKLVDLVAPGYFGGEAACAIGKGGCPTWYPTESMRGTSESCPLIAGVAADVIEGYSNSHGGTTPKPGTVRGAC